MKRGALAASVLPFGLSFALLTAGCASTDVAAVAARDMTQVQTDARERAAVPPAAGTVRDLLARPLTSESAVRIALLQNRALLAEYERLGVARAAVEQAGRLPNPVLSGRAVFYDDGTEIEGGLAQPLLAILLGPLRVREAEAGAEAERARVARTVVRTVFDVRRAFAGVRASVEIVALRRSALDVAESSRRLMRELFDAGNVTGRAQALEDVATARLRLDLHAAEMMAGEARENLNLLLGVWGADTAWSLDRDAPAVEPTVDLEQVEARAVRSSLDLAEDRAEIEREAQQAGLISWEAALPHLDAGATATRDVDLGWGIGPEAAIALPVFDDGSARDLASRARLRERLLHHEAHAVEIRSAARRLRDRIEALDERANFMATVELKARDRVVHQTLLQYNAMQTGAFDVLTARRLELESQRVHFDTLHAARMARLDLLELLAGVLHPARVHAASLPSGSESDSSPQSGGH